MDGLILKGLGICFPHLRLAARESRHRLGKGFRWVRIDWS